MNFELLMAFTTPPEDRENFAPFRLYFRPEYYWVIWITGAELEFTIKYIDNMFIDFDIESNWLCPHIVDFDNTERSWGDIVGYPELGE